MNSFVPTYIQLTLLVEMGNRIARKQYESVNELFKELGPHTSYRRDTLSRLEGREGFNTQIVDRIKLQLTPAGMRIYAWARKLLDEYARVPTGMGQSVLRVGTGNRLTTTYLGQCISSFLNQLSKDHDSVAVDLQEISADEILRQLNQGLIDIGVCMVPDVVDTKGLTCHKFLLGKPMVLIASKKVEYGPYQQNSAKANERIPVSELKKASLCLTRTDERQFRNWLPAPAKGYHRIIVDNYASVVSIVSEGNTLGLVIDLGLPKDILIFRFCEDEQPQDREFAVWTRQNETLSAEAQLFMNIVLGTAKQK